METISTGDYRNKIRKMFMKHKKGFLTFINDFKSFIDMMPEICF